MFPNVRFAEKLDKLIGSRSRAEIATISGLPAQTITNYVTRGTEPSVSAALRLARAMDVDLDWLADEAQDWSPPKQRNSEQLLKLASDEDLRNECSERYRRAAIGLRTTLEELSKLDLQKLARIIASTPLNEPLPSVAQRAKQLFDALQGYTLQTRQFDAVPLGMMMLDAHPKFKNDELMPKMLGKVEASLHGKAGFKDFDIALSARAVLQRESPDDGDIRATVRKWMADFLKKSS